MHNARRQQMQDERLVAHLHGVAGIMSALIARHDVEVLGQKVNYLAFAFIAPLRADDNNYFGHLEFSANSKQQTVNSRKTYLKILKDIRRELREQ
jgi:hypothetical protein